MSVMLPQGHVGPSSPAAETTRAEARVWRRARVLAMSYAATLMRIFWIVCAVFSLYVFLATNPSRFRQMQDLWTMNSYFFGQFGFDRENLPLYMIALDSIAFLTYALVGLLVFWRKSSDQVAFFGSLALVTAGITIARPINALFFIDEALRVPILLLFMLGTGSILFFLYLFPGGHFTPRWLMWPALVLSGYPLALILQQILSVAESAWPPPSTAQFTVPAITLALVSQIYHYRHGASQTQQQQTKWVVFGVAVGTIVLVGFLVLMPLLLPAVLEFGMERTLYIVLGVPIFYLGLMSLPIAIAMSILRYRLWDIDVLIRQTILYGTLTAFVAGLFAAAITLGQRVFVALTGQKSDIAAVIATLLVVALVTPVKDQLQRRLERKLKGGPDPSVRLRGFLDRVNARVSPVEPNQIARRMVDEAVAAYNAKSGAVYWQVDGRLNLAYRTAEWDGDPRLHADMGKDMATRIGALALGERRDGDPYSESDRQLMHEVASAIADAIEQDRVQV